MKKRRRVEYSVPRLPEYERIDVDWNRLSAMHRSMMGPKRPTSIALEPDAIAELRQLAKKLELPYQVVMRLMIYDGLNRAQEGMFGPMSMVRDASDEKPYTIPARFIPGEEMKRDKESSRELLALIRELRKLVRELGALAERLSAGR